MNTNNKPNSANTNASDRLREATDTGAKQSKEVFEKIGAATSEAAHVMASSCSTALRGIQDYNSKVLEFTQVNAKSNVEFVQKLASAKSPSEFIEVSTDHARRQFEILAEQTKQLAALAHQVTLATAEPLKTSLAKASDRAA